MKKTILIITLIALMAVSGAQSIGGGIIEASVLRYEPTPAEQGNTVDVWIQLSNIGTRTDQVAVKFMPEYPFSLPPGQAEKIDVGAVAATEEKVVKFTVFIDPNAPNAEKNVSFMYKYGATDQWAVLESPITIQTQDAVLLIEDYKISPLPVVPGQIATVEMQLRNAGRIGLKNIDVDVQVDDEKFSTVGTGTKKRVNYIPPGETEKIEFELASDTSTEVKVYSIPVQLNYLDERNKEYSDEAKVTLVVNAEPELSLTVDKTDFRRKTGPGTVTLKIVNKGVVDFKYVTVKLIQMPDYRILSPSNEAYVGNLDSDDYETVEFIIEPEVEKPRLSVQLEFKDPYNMDFTKKYDLPLRIFTESELKPGGFPWVTVIIIFAAAGGIFYWWRKKKNKKGK